MEESMQNWFNKTDMISMVKNEEITPEEAVALFEEMEMNKDFVPESFEVQRDWVIKEMKDSFHESSILYAGKSLEDCQRVELAIEKQGITFYGIYPGSGYRKVNNHIYELDITRSDDFKEVYQDISQMDEVPSHVLFHWGEEEASLNSRLQRSIYTMLFFIKQYLEHRKASLKLVFVTEDVMDLALSGFFKSLQKENSNYQCKVVIYDKKEEDTKILNELTLFDSCVVKYRGGERYIEVISEKEEKTSKQQVLALKQGGTYFITGGCKGIGYILAKYIAKRYQATLILCGRSKYSNEVEEKLEALRKSGAKAMYFVADVSNRNEMEQLYSKLKQENVKLDGILHSAGCIRDSFLLRKTEKEISDVLSAKIYGTCILDEVFYEEPLDFFVLFSSVNAVTGNAGQTDYAFANSYMDVFADVRNEAVANNRRSGKTISINWTPWMNGGMKLSSREKASFIENTGYLPLPDPIGFKILEYALNEGDTNFILAYGKKEKLKQRFCTTIKVEETAKHQKQEFRTMEQEEEKIIAFLKDMFSELLKLPVTKIDVEEPFQDYGIDSIVINQFNYEVEKLSLSLPKTILYECKSIQELAEYIVTHHRDMVDLICDESSDSEEEDLKIQEESLAVEEEQVDQTKENTMRVDEMKTEERNVESHCDEDIAIIGVSGKYPDANNCDELWKNLIQGKDSIRELPKERWDMEEYYTNDEQKKTGAYTNCKWGGFLDGIDEFDAPLFRISPREAELMDPQERLFIEQVFAALENAAYSIKNFRENSKEDGIHKVGVFVGVTSNTYALWGSNQLANHSGEIPKSYPWSVANRISYLFDFNGPSVAIDTACSSSLSALHMACESIHRGECKSAVVGGVNLYLHPIKYILLSQLNMLSSTGTCKAFGTGADGFIPGEGVGALILKPLSKAKQDGDHILAVIKGSAMNHGGASNGYTVPNPAIQANVISQALKNAKVSPETISYIEAHGTGTDLGDPIEITGLSKVFGPSKEKYCAVGSLKANIGHLEAAAGVVAITKVIYQMQNRVLVPSIHSEKINEKIEFDGTPMYLSHEFGEWKPSGNSKRRAGVSSFGAGGTNVHVVLEEYDSEQEFAVTKRSGKQLIVLSANTSESLHGAVKKLLAYLEDTSCELADVAYTLQVGRNVLNERIAFVAESIDDVKKTLKAYEEGNHSVVYAGNYVDNKDSGKLPSISKSQIQAYFEEGDLEKLASVWADGAEVDFNYAWKSGKANRLVLPTYEFAKNKYWFREAKPVTKVEAKVEPIVKVEPVVKSEPIEMKQAPITKEYRLDYQEELKKFPEQTNTDAVKVQIVEEHIAVITMQDRTNKNMLSDELYQGLIRIFAQIASDESIHAVVLTGYDNIFCMGGMKDNLEEIAEQKALCSDGTFVYRGLLSCPVPVVAAMQGHAFGGGLMLGMFADIIVMAEESIYSANFTRYGFTPGVGTTFILSQKLGDALAQEMMYTANEYQGSELKERGVTIQMRKRSEVLESAIEIARSLAKKPRNTLTTLKKELAKRVLTKLPQYIESEVAMHQEIFGGSVAKEAKVRIQQYFNDTPSVKPAKPVGLTRLNLVNGAKAPEEPKASNLPKDSNGKLMLKSITTQQAKPIQPVQLTQSKPVVLAEKTQNNTMDCLLAIISDILHIDRQEVNIKLSVRELGMDSISGVELIREINKQFGLSMEAYLLYEFPSIKQLAIHIDSTQGTKTSPQIELKEKEIKEEPVFKQEIPVVEAPQEVPVEVQRTTTTNVMDQVLEIISDVLRISKESINLKLSLKDLGMDSITGVELVRELNKTFHTTMETINLYDFGSVKRLVEFINGQASSEEVQTKSESPEIEETDELIDMLMKLQDQQMNLDEVDHQLEELL